MSSAHRPNGAQRIRSALQGEGPKLIAYLMAGDPDLKATAAYVRALQEAGVALVELGVPFSDPIADGPTIQAAATRALAAGMQPAMVLDLVRDLRSAGVSVPIVLMTYYNILHRAGVASWCKAATEAGVDGCIIPDLPVEESAELRAAAQPVGLGTTFLASPATNGARLARIVEASTGFVYLVSLYGVTGARTELPSYTLELVQRVKERTQGRAPLGVGFGVSTAEQVHTLHAAGADAVIVGSAIVERVAQGQDPEQLGRFVRSLIA